MAITITEQNWLALHAAGTLSGDLVGLISLMRDKRMSEQNVRCSLEQIRQKAQFLADFCTTAIDRL